MSSLLPKHIRLGRDFSSLPSRNAHKKRADQVIDSSCSIRSQQALHARRELVQPRLHGTATLAEMRRDLAHCGPWMLGEMLTPFLLGLRKFLTRRPKQVCYQYVTSVLPVRDSCVTQSFSILYRIVSSARLDKRREGKPLSETALSALLAGSRSKCPLLPVWD